MNRKELLEKAKSLIRDAEGLGDADRNLWMTCIDEAANDSIWFFNTMILKDPAMLLRATENLRKKYEKKDNPEELKKLFEEERREIQDAAS